MTQQPPGQEKLVEYVEDDERAEPGPNGEDPNQPALNDANPASAPVKKPFRLSNGTLEYHERHEDAEGNVSYVSVCSDLRVVAMTKDVNGEEWGRLLLLTDPDGQEHEWAMPMAMLSADGNAYRERLLSMGLIMVPGRKTKDRLYIYIASQSPDARVRCVARTGWHNDTFVMPNETFGASSERIILQSSYRPDHAMRSAGSLLEWKEHIAQRCIRNSRLAFAVSVAFAAPLLTLAGEESGGFHLRGGSSIGKTTVAYAAGSVWGGGKKTGYLETWRATSNGLESVAEAHCDSLLCLDEISQIEAKDAGATAYMLANESGKKRARKDGSGRPSAQWKVLFLSTREMSLADKINEAGRRSTAGQEIRLVELPADTGIFGLFEDLHDAESADQFAVQIRTAAQNYYGTAIREFLTRITSNNLGEVAEAVKAARARFVQANCPRGATGQIKRVAGRFGVVAAAGELATALGITGWPKDEATNATTILFNAWLETRDGTEPAEMASAIANIRLFLERHGESRFPWIHAEDRNNPSINRAGFRKRSAKDPDVADFLVFPETFRTEICRGFDPKSVINALVERGLLVCDKDGKPQSRHKIPGMGTKRIYFIPHTILADEAEAGPDVE